MPWATVAIVSSAVTALVSISDKTVMYRYARSPLTLPLMIGLAQTTVGVVVLGLIWIPAGTTAVASGFALLSGILFGFSGLLSQRVLFVQEVSRTIPVTQSAPIFAAVLALVVLDEAISPIQWLGIIVTVWGSTLLSLRIDGGRFGSVFLHGSFYVLMLSAFLMGAAMVVGKIAIDELPVLYTHGLRMLALGVVFLLFSWRHTPWGDVKSYIYGRSPALLFVATNEFIIANIGLLLLLWALSIGPVSLVTALMGTRALFVVVYSTSLAIVWRGALGEQLSPGVLVVKVFSAFLIVAGVAALAM